MAPRTAALHRAVAALLGALALGACTASAQPAGAARTELVVSAASSLTDVADALARAFEAADPRVDVTLNLGGSAALREQVLAGAPVDVLATASAAAMDDVVSAGLVSGTVAFATNGLVLVVPAGNPAAISGLADLAEPGPLVGVCAAGVPCGDLALAAADAAGVTIAADTQEPNVRALLAKVVAGELDAGLVYATDASTAADTVEVIALPAQARLATTYVAAALLDPPAGALADAFVAFLGSDEARAVLSAAGFGPPP